MNAKADLLSAVRKHNSQFSQRHIGLADADVQSMLQTIGCASVDALIEQTIPESIRLAEAPDIGVGLSEVDALDQLRTLASHNKVLTSLIGQGYYNTHVPNVIARNVLENPGWYTAYTPYQPEISQGRLEALLNYQQMVMDLTGMSIANASLLDEATAAAEAMMLCKRGNRKNKSSVFFVADDVHPQTLAVLTTRAKTLGITLAVQPLQAFDQHPYFGALLQYPNTQGEVVDIASLISRAHEKDCLVAVGADLLALTLLEAPGEFGADIVFGSAQRFGVPMGFGGPHAAFFACRDDLKRQMPGRVIGVSKDTNNRPALRMAMQTREQHIRREKATSNICTAQALLANMAGFYAVYHGPDGLQEIARRVHRFTGIFAGALAEQGIACNSSYFDTLRFANAQGFAEALLAAGYNVRRYDNGDVGVSFDETTTEQDVATLLFALGCSEQAVEAALAAQPVSAIPQPYQRQTPFLQNEVFHNYRSETQMLRYLKQLENKDYSLTHGMIPLGSCTMKLNATAEMIPVSWPEFANMHPFAPQDQTLGYQQIFRDLTAQLAGVTGYDAVSLQPNSGAQGEYAGLLAIARYHEARGEGDRNICLIPASAHGTNPASAALLNMKIVVVKCDDSGNVDMTDFRAKAEKAGAQLAACMITYPSTHGVFETQVRELCNIVHEFGGQVYLDGANMNAQVGFTSPGFIGADVSHLNLHKTFAIPHGGGGPGMGPIGVKAHLAEFLPGDSQSSEGAPVSAASFGSASILPISWMYLRMLGSEGIRQSTAAAILSANYLADALADDFEVLYRGEHGRVAHECIIDLRPFKASCGISEEDVAKRLMDYGFHAPTMSFPVPGTLMIEPTESEDLAELNRFVAAMKSIRKEIADVESGLLSAEASPLRHAPHTTLDLTGAWNRAYSREQGVFPLPSLVANKFWPAMNRIDNVYGDRNLICSCVPLSEYLSD
ncbi:aminomethyl-transferring glycine dehydrogenase [Reinekea marinisedimentorum]|uniref:Glycine dehydrogenase (decarboxylating) n=1 Tax=Reinekea marinisedimentorum TaxID=230495 RepID=A0A4R3I3M6_9GAMM|nr:aminomethyl-transferring glycine dehydrogenase [Reinekea marinisedimentorum]TCS40434.1 glycine dehydrogenase [Reinekea marinisedimentorum]